MRFLYFFNDENVFKNIKGAFSLWKLKPHNEKAASIFDEKKKKNKGH